MLRSIYNKIYFLLFLSILFTACFKKPTPPVAKINISKQQLEVNDQGGVDTFIISLTTQPSDNVYIGVYTNNTRIVSLNQQELVFTAKDWQPKEIRVTGLEITNVQTDQEFEIITLPSISTDKDYNNIDIINLVGVNRKSLQPITYTLQSINGVNTPLESLFILSENNTSSAKSYNVVLSREPGGTPVQIAINTISCNTATNPRNISITSLSDNNIITSTTNGYLLTFSNTTTMVTLTVTALRDGISEAPQQNCTIEHIINSNVNVTRTINLSILDADNTILDAINFPSSITENTRQAYWLNFTKKPLYAIYNLLIQKSTVNIDQIDVENPYIFLYSVKIRRKDAPTVPLDTIEEQPICLNTIHSQRSDATYDITVNNRTYTATVSPITRVGTLSLPIDDTHNGTCIKIDTVELGSAPNNRAIPNNSISSTITHNIASCTPDPCPVDYISYNSSFPILFLDKDRPGIFISKVPNAQTDTFFYHFFDQTLTYYIKLLSQPNQNVTLNINLNDIYAGRATFTSNSITGNTSALSFTPTSWNVPQSVLLRYTSPYANNFYESYNVIYTTLSVDPLYNSTQTTPTRTFFHGLEFKLKDVASNSNFNFQLPSNPITILREGGSTSFFEYEVKALRAPIIDNGNVSINMTLRNTNGTNSAIPLTIQDCTSNTQAISLNFTAAESYPSTKCLRLKLPANTISASTNLRLCNSLASGAFLNRTDFLNMYDSSAIPTNLQPTQSTPTPTFFCIPLCVLDSNDSSTTCAP